MFINPQARRFPAASCSVLARSVFGLLATGVSGLAAGAEWDSTFGIAPEVTFSDNVCLEEENKQSEWIGSLTPELSFVGRGQRASVAFDGSLQFHTLDNNNTECDNPEGNRADSPIPDLQTTAQAELVKGWLFFDGSAQALQNTVNQFRAGGGGLNRAGNFNTTRQYSVSPYIQRRLKNAANLRVAYRYSDQRNSEDIVGDSTLDSFDASLSSIQNGSPVSWSLSAYSTEVEFDGDDFVDADSSELSAVILQLGYQLSRSWQINGSVGEEDNDFPSVDDDIDGSRWDVGFLYTPNSRISVSAGTGDRFFGTAPRAEIEYRHKRTVLAANYSKDTNFARDIRGGEGIGGGGSGNPTSLARGPVIEERFTLSYRYEGRRHSLDIQGRTSNQERTDIEDDSTFSSASLTFTRTLSRSSEFSIQLNWDEREADDRGQDVLTNDSETWWGSIGYTRKIGEQVAIDFQYQYVDRDSDFIGDSFEENRATAGINFTF